MFHVRKRSPQRDFRPRETWNVDLELPALPAPYQYIFLAGFTGSRPRQY
jgi:hypothetical protein